MAFPVINPFFQFFDNAGEPLAEGTVETYESGTSTPKVTYQNATLSTANSTTIDLDSAGRCSIFVGDGESFKYILKDAGGSTVDTQDGVKSPVGTQAGIGALLYPRTAAESAASVTPTNYAYPPGDVRRYGDVFASAAACLAAFNDAIAVAAEGGGPVLVYETGTDYVVSDDIVVDASNVQVIGIGWPVVRTTDATGSVILCDGGASSGRIEAVKVENLILDGGTYGLKTRSCHRSTFRNLRARNQVTAAFEIEFAVANTYDTLICSNDVDTFTTVPTYGIHATRRGVGSEVPTDLCFINPTMKGLGTNGIYFEYCDNSVVLGGNSEYCTTGGVRIASGSDSNTFINHFCEGNGTTASNYDFRVASDRNQFINCTASSGDSAKSIWVEGGRGNEFRQGFYTNASVDAAAVRTTFEKIHRAGTLTDAGTQTVIRDVDGGGVDFDASMLAFLGASNPTLLNSWANFGSGTKNAGFFIDPFGIVRLQGTVASGTVGTVIFTLDAGFRPSAIQSFLCFNNGTTDVVVVNVEADGDVTHVSGVNTRVALDGISFLADG